MTNGVARSETSESRNVVPRGETIGVTNAVPRSESSETRNAAARSETIRVTSGVASAEVLTTLERVSPGFAEDRPSPGSGLIFTASAGGLGGVSRDAVKIEPSPGGQKPNLRVRVVDSARDPAPEVQKMGITSPIGGPETVSTFGSVPEVQTIGMTSAVPQGETRDTTSLIPSTDSAQLHTSRKPLRLVFDAPTQPAIDAPREEDRPLRAALPVAQEVVRATIPVWEEARRVTHEAFTVERAETSSNSAAASTSGVTNNFNVNVHVDPQRNDAQQDRESLERTLFIILRDAARRNGLEV